MSRILLILEELFCGRIRREQRKWRRDHILNKYDDSDWRNDIFW